MQSNYAAIQALSGTAPDYHQIIFNAQSLGPRGLLASKSFEFYRVVSAVVKLYPGGVDARGNGVGWVPGVPTAVPTAFNDLTQMPKYCLITSAQTVPTMLRLSRRDLLRDNQLKWWRVDQTTTVEPGLEYQGVLYFATNTISSTSSMFYEICLTIEFCGPIAETQLSYEVPMTRTLDDDEKSYVSARESHDLVSAQKRRR